jgi:hypothetical protein
VSCVYRLGSLSWALKMQPAPKKSPRKSPGGGKSPGKSPGQRLTAALARIPQPDGVDQITQTMGDAGVAQTAHDERVGRVARLQSGAEGTEEGGAAAEPGNGEGDGGSARTSAAHAGPEYVAPVAPWARTQPAAASQPLPPRPHFATLLQEAQAESDAELARRMSGQTQELQPQPQPEPEPQLDLLRPDVEVVASLVSMGFEANCCKRAALATGNADVQAALDWVLANMDSPGINEPFGDEEKLSELAPDRDAADESSSSAGGTSDEWVDVEQEAEEPVTTSLPVCPGGWVAVGDADKQQTAQPAASTAATVNTSSAAAAVAKTQEEQDAELAAALQAAQSAQAEEDASLAAALQLEMELEHDREVREREVMENRRQGGHARPLDGESRIRVDMSRHYIRGPHHPLYVVNSFGLRCLCFCFL